MNLKFVKRNETFGQILRDVAQTHPDREAIIFENQRVTFAQLVRRVERLAIGFQELGIEKGDNICIVLPNCPEYLYIIGALGYIGAVAVPMSVQSGANDMQHILSDSEAVAVITVEKAYGTDLLGIIKDIQPSLHSLRNILVQGGSGDAEDRDTIDMASLINADVEVGNLEPITDPSTPAMILYTSGTTGKPKGAVHSHRTLLMGIHLFLGKLNSMMKPSWELISSALKTIKTWKRVPWLIELAMAFIFDSQQVKLLLMSPFYHIAGYFQILIVLLTGGRIVIMDRFHPGKALELIQKERVTFIFGVPPMFRAMIDRPDFNSYDVNSLVLSATGAMPVPPQLVRDIKEKIGGLVLVVYGATEMAGGIFTWATDPDEKQAETVGHKNVVEGMEIRIVDDDHKDLPPGEVGEIAVRTPSLMEGYYKRSEATTQAMDGDGWYYSGDLGLIDDQGYVKVLGRRGDLILRGGANIYPAEIENYLLAHPKIKQVAVIGVPSDSGETIRAYVVLEEGAALGAGDIKGFCWGQIAANKVPEEIVFVKNLPVTSATQKIQHYKLRQQALAERTADT
jgi:fatty-acyl-CoA synthase/long-chain acyl-CoA synthetase